MKKLTLIIFAALYLNNANAQHGAVAAAAAVSSINASRATMTSLHTTSSLSQARGIASAAPTKKQVYHGNYGIKLKKGDTFTLLSDMNELRTYVVRGFILDGVTANDTEFCIKWFWIWYNCPCSPDYMPYHDLYYNKAFKINP